MIIIEAKTWVLIGHLNNSVEKFVKFALSVGVDLTNDIFIHSESLDEFLNSHFLFRRESFSPFKGMTSPSTTKWRWLGTSCDLNPGIGNEAKFTSLLTRMSAQSWGDTMSICGRESADTPPQFWSSPAYEAALGGFHGQPVVRMLGAGGAYYWLAPQKRKFRWGAIPSTEKDGWVLLFWS